MTYKALNSDEKPGPFDDQRGPRVIATMNAYPLRPSGPSAARGVVDAGDTGGDLGPRNDVRI